MKVAINALLLGGRESGVERSIRGLLKALDAIVGKGEVTAVVGPGFADEGWTPRNIEIHRTVLPTGWRLVRIVYDQLLFPLVSRVRGARVIHGPGYVVPRLASLPCVVTVHDIIALKHPELCKWSNVKHFRLVLPASVRHARQIIVPTNAVKKDLEVSLDVSPRKIHVIPPGIDEAFRPVSHAECERVRELYRLPRNYVLYVGNIEPKKNIETLIKAFYAVKMDQGLPHKLVIAGAKGWKCKAVFDLVHSLRFEDAVAFTGYVPQADLPGLYAGADCFAFPSLVEGFGIPPLEAMACGTPVIASTAPALVEATGHAAIHVPPRETSELRKALELVLLDSAESERLRQAGFEQASKFTWHRTAQETLKVYEHALS